MIRRSNFKLLRQVKDFVEQVVEGLTFLKYPWSNEKGANHPLKRIFSMYLPSSQDSTFKLLRQVKNFMGQVAEGMKILIKVPWGFTKKG